MNAETKPINPKEGVGSTKPSTVHVPSTALFALGEAHADGARKYGSHNWRDAGVRVSTYLEAIQRHLAAWKEGEEVASDSGVHHLAHVMACCAIVIDSQACGNLNDDRPTPIKGDWFKPYRDRALGRHWAGGAEPSLEDILREGQERRNG